MNALKQITALQKPVNIVLSGGGAKGVAHIAFLEKLEETGLKVKAISGSSAGALVGALYALGMPTDEILSFFKSVPLFKLSYIVPTKPGVFDTVKYGNIIKKYIPLKFEDLNIPLVVTATNLQKGQATYFSTGELLRPILASCAVPALFSPVKINNELYTDGGVMDNFPIAPFKDSTELVLGSYVCKPNYKTTKDLNSILKMTNHANALLVYGANQHKFEQINHTTIFPLGEFGTFDTKKIDEIYEKAKAYLES